MDCWFYYGLVPLLAGTGFSTGIYFVGPIQPFLGKWKTPNLKKGGEHPPKEVVVQNYIIVGNALHNLDTQ